MAECRKEMAFLPTSVSLANPPDARADDTYVCALTGRVGSIRVSVQVPPAIGQEGFMNGYQITFFTEQSKRHHGRPLADWLVHLAQELKLSGATLMAGGEGFGQHGRIHSAHFFELADQPVEVLIAVTSEEAERLFARLKSEGVHLFYVKTAVEFGTLGEPGS
jgi:uncharacterized protein